MLALKEAGRVTLWTRHETGFTDRLPRIAGAVRPLSRGPSGRQRASGRATRYREKARWDFREGQLDQPRWPTQGFAQQVDQAALAIMEADAETISRKAVELALGGDLTAIRIVLDRLVAPRRDRPVEIALPKIVAASDLVAAASAIVEAIAEGTVTPSEAAALSTAVSGVAKAVETFELAERLTRLEEQTATKGSAP